MTTSGRMLVIDEVTKSKGKLPFERILVCRKIGSKFKMNPSKLIIYSVPSGIHSKKPPLDGKIQIYL